MDDIETNIKEKPSIITQQHNLRVQTLNKIGVPYDAISNGDNFIHNGKLSNILYTHDHDTLPLTIITYNKQKRCSTNSKQLISNFDACRGLIIEKQTNKIISRGFDRFVQKYINPSEQFNVKKITVKEDGSLIHMFKYNNRWMLSTLHNFANDKVCYADLTYEELFLQIINMPLDDFANGLIEQFDNEDNIMTFCFEMCSIHNRIIRRYDVPTLFLIGVFCGEFGENEIDIHNYKFKKDFLLPDNVKVIKCIGLGDVVSMDVTLENSIKTIQKKITSFETAMEVVSYFTENDLHFEGVVLDTDIGKIKVKNPYYLIQHELKYKGWHRCTPQLLMPLILDKLHVELLSNTSKALGLDPVFNYEINERVNFCINRIEREYETIITVINQLADMNLISKEEYMKTLGSQFPTIKMVWESLFIEVSEDIRHIRKRNCEQFNEVFRRHIVINLDKIFKIDPFIDNKHDQCYCAMTSANIPEELNQYENNGISQSKTDCYCGKKIIVKRLDCNIVRYNYCHCGMAFGYNVYNSGEWVGICEDSECLCVNDVDQRTKQIIGTPCSTMCKVLRSNVFELIKTSSLEKSQCMNLINKLIKKDNVDINNLGISECVLILTRLKQFEQILKEVNIRINQRHEEEVHSKVNYCDNAH